LTIAFLAASVKAFSAVPASMATSVSLSTVSLTNRLRPRAALSSVVRDEASVRLLEKSSTRRERRRGTGARREEEVEGGTDTWNEGGEEERRDEAAAQSPVRMATARSQRWSREEREGESAEISSSA